MPASEGIMARLRNFFTSRKPRPVDSPPTAREIEAAKWFKATFGKTIEAACSGTPITTNLLTAIAMQETYYIWVKMYKDLPLSEVLLHCTGDSIGEPDRKYFPKTVKQLKAHSNGAKMFEIGRQCLARTGKYIPSYKEKYDRDPKIFCHGYGIFQYDIQFFERENPDFFLDMKWQEFSECLALAKAELQRGIIKLNYTNKKSLTHNENVFLAISYNAGNADTSASFRQGHYNKDEQTYYGEYIHRFLTMIEKLP